MVVAVSAQKLAVRPFPLHDDHASAGSRDLPTALPHAIDQDRGRCDDSYGYCVADQSLSELFRHYPVLFHETAANFSYLLC